VSGEKLPVKISLGGNKKLTLIKVPKQQIAFLTASLVVFWQKRFLINLATLLS